jgi:hypothetical protein
LHAALARHCGGNPLFVLETLKHLHLQGSLQARAHGSTAHGPLPLPPSVHAVLTQRLAGLTEAAQNLARVAAVAGSEFSVAVAADVMGVTALAVAAPWAELQQAQVFGSHSPVALDAVRTGLPQALLAPLHAGVAHSLQKSAAPPQTVAHHFAAAGQPGAAAPLACTAAHQALQQGRHADQLAHLQQAAAWYTQAGQAADAFDAQVATVPVLLVHAGVGPAALHAAFLLQQPCSAAQRLALLLEQATVALAAHDVPTLQQASQAAWQAAVPGTTTAWRAQALHATGLAFAGHNQQALQAVADVQQLMAAAAQAAAAQASAAQASAAESANPADPASRADVTRDDICLAAELHGHLAMVFAISGHARACVGVLQQQLQLARQVGDVEQEATALSGMAGQTTNLGDALGAHHSAQAAALLFRRLGSAGSALANDINWAYALLALNHYSEAADLIAATQQQCEATGASPDLLHIVAEMRAALHLRLGQPSAALQALASQPVPQSPRRQAQRLLLQAQHALLVGQPAQAREAWLAVQGLLPLLGDTVLGLSARAISSRVLPAAQAQEQLRAVLAAAVQADMPSAQALALLAQAQRALDSEQSGEKNADGKTGAKGSQRATALAIAQQLWALRTSASHLLLDEGVLCAAVCSITSACASPSAARRMRTQAQQAFVSGAQAHVPPAALHSWRQHPLRLALWAPIER